MYWALRTSIRWLLAALLVGCASILPDRLASTPTVSAVTQQPSVASSASGPRVEVIADKSEYQPGETIVVTIRNHLSVAIFALTGQTYCTIVTAERRVDDNWQAPGACAAAMPPEYMVLAPDSETTVELSPQLAVDQQLPDGEYRIRFVFRTGAADGPEETVYSQTFFIGGQVPAVRVTSEPTTIQVPTPVTPTQIVTPTISITPSAAISGPTTTQSSPTESDVVVTTDKSAYQSGETVVVTISNHLSVSIFALTGQTYCTIVTAERRANDDWQTAGACAAVPPEYLEITSDSETTVELYPRLAVDQELPDGEYRIRFVYRVGSSDGLDQTAHSQPFLIGNRILTQIYRLFLSLIRR